MYIRLRISLLSDIAKTIPKATAEKNLHNLLIHVFESEFNKKIQNGKSMGSYYLPSDITFQEHTKEKFEAIKKKNCDAVIKIGSAASYNFGPYYSNIEEQTVSEYGTSIMTMLENELSLIKAKISEVAQELGKEEPETTTTNGVLKTVT